MFEQTLRSICNQTCESFDVIVVCHEKPEIAFEDPRVHYIKVDFPLELSWKDRPEGCDLDYEIKSTDKGRKMLTGYLAAQDYGPTHIMFVDADDLVSCRLAELCKNEPKSKGWASEQGYRYRFGSRWIYKKRFKFHKECGTGFIIRSDLVPAPQQPEFDRGFDYYRFFINHTYVVQKMSQAGSPLEKLPFSGAVYVIHGSSFYGTGRFASQRLRERLLKLFKNVLNLRPLTPSIRREFGMM